MKGDFIPKFIEAIIKSGKELYSVWQWQPLYYKGFRVSGYSYKKADNGFRNLKNRGFITSISDKEFRFTPKGRKWFKGSLLKYHRSIKTKWNGKWQVVVFDIPQELHRERNRFRSKLKTFGFFMIQKSVYVFPFPCEEELADYCKKMGVGDYINILISENLGHIEEEVKKFYNL